jgi:multidrug resistance efflux pump
VILYKKIRVIAKLDTTALFAAYKQADASLRASQAALNYTYDTLQGKENTESFSEISTRTAAETTKDKAYWAFVAASKALEGAYIKAPFDGILTQSTG